MRVVFSIFQRPAHRLALPVLLIGMILGAVTAPGTAIAQQSANIQIAPVGGSGVAGRATATAEGQGAMISLTLTGLPAGAEAQASLAAGTCAQPSASALRLLALTADSSGRATASGRVTIGPGSSMALADVADGDHILSIMSGGRVVACGSIPALANLDLPAALVAEGEHHQVMQFNPGAALQRRVFADGFVPSSGEFGLTLEATPFTIQRVEHLGTGAVRVYYARTDDWGNVRYYQRGGSLDALGRALLAEAERRQAIQFNPNAALQKAIFADGFVPNSGEFSLQTAGTSFTGQRAEHLGTGQVRVYYAVTGQWGNVNR